MQSPACDLEQRKPESGWDVYYVEWKVNEMLPVFFGGFLALDWVVISFPDEVGGSWSVDSKAGCSTVCSATSAAFFLTVRAALASAARFFFARSPMVDRKDDSIELLRVIIYVT